MSSLDLSEKGIFLAVACEAGGFGVAGSGESGRWVGEEGFLKAFPKIERVFRWFCLGKVRGDVYHFAWFLWLGGFLWDEGFVACF